MKINIYKIIITIQLIALATMTQTVYAEGINDSIIISELPKSEKFSVYQSKLTQINRSLGTNYVLDVGNLGTYDDMVIFFESMSLDEFKNYIYSAYKNEHSSIYTINRHEYEYKPKELELCAKPSLKEQRYYYGMYNYLYIKAYTNKDANTQKTVYTGAITTKASHIENYPAYQIASVKTSFSKNKTKVTCNWKLRKQLNEYVYDAAEHSLKCTFTAGGGNLYPEA